MIFNLKLKVLAKSETENKKVIRSSSSDPIVRGTGDIDYLCGTCEHVIAQSVNRWEFERLTNAAFECYRCNSVNSLN